MLRSWDVIVYARPVPWHRAGSNRATGAHFKRKEDLQAQFQIRMAWMAEHGHLGQLQGPIRLAVTCFLPAPKGMSKKKRRSNPLPVIRPDLDNLMKQVKDALSKYAFKDDAQVVTELCRKRYALSPEGEDTPARWVITVDEIVEGDDANAEGEIAGIWGSQEPDRHGPLSEVGTSAEERAAVETTAG